jgi:two-component system cell cycle response regulator
MTSASHVLIVDDDESITRALSLVLREQGFRASTLHTAERLLDFLDKNGIDLLILDVGLPGVDGLSVLSTIKRHPAHRDLPIIMLSSAPPEETTERALSSGAIDFVAKPFRVTDLLARIRAHLRVGRALYQARAEARSQAERVDILREVTAAVTPAEIYQILVRRMARALKVSKCSIVLAKPHDEIGTVVAAAENPSLRHLSVELKRYPELLGPLITNQPLLSIDLGNDPFFAGMREVWRDEGRLVPTTSAVVIPFSLKGSVAGAFYLRTSGDDPILANEDLAFAQETIAAAASLLEKAYDFEEAIRRQDEMRQLAETDPLTGLYNRRAFRDKLERELDRAERYQTVVSCLMLDIDHFKRLNDSYGHDLGDRVLVQLAELLKREQRAMDVLARLGGEEFVVLLPETGIRGARIFAERILRRVSSTVFGDARQEAHITVSIGISSFPDDRITDGDSLLRAADTNLLRAKTDGRNRYRD